jgi:hypothetical protein
MVADDVVSPERHLTEARVGWNRWAPVGGILFAVLLIAGIIVRGTTPDYDRPDEWIPYFQDSGNRTQQIIGGYLVILSALAFLVFATALYGRMRAAEGERSRLPMLTFGSGMVFVALLLAAATVFTSVAGSVSFGDAPVPSADIAIQIEQLGFGLLLLAAMPAAIIFVVSASLSALGTRMLPTWLAWAGIVVAVLLIFSPLFLPAVLLPLWALAVGIILLRA